jgi:acyl carrier protein
MAVAGGGRDPDTEPTTVEYVFTGEEWFLDEHRIAGTPVLAGAAYIDLIVNAVRERRLIAAEHPVAIRRLVFLSPLSVVYETSVRLVFSARGDVYHVTISSRARGDHGWILRGEADVARWAESASAVRLDLLRQRWADAEDIGAGGQPGIMSLGPRWKNALRRRTRGGNYLAELRLAEDYWDDLRAHAVHPALLDIATSVITVGQPGRSYLPFSYRQAVFFRPLPAELVAVTSSVREVPGLISGDVDLYDLRGRHLAHITGFCMREVTPEQAARSLTRPVAEPGPEEAVALDRPGWLSPADGTHMLLKILDGDLPPSVTVLPPGVPLQVPGHVLLSDTNEQAQSRAAAVPPPVRSLPASTAAPSRAAQAPAATLATSARAVAPVGTADPSAAQPGGAVAELRRLWGELIGRDSVGLDDDFFDLGGTSLTVVQLIARIRDLLGVEVGVGLIFEKRTVRSLGEAIDKLRAM